MIPSVQVHSAILLRLLRVFLGVAVALFFSHPGEVGFRGTLMPKSFLIGSGGGALQSVMDFLLQPSILRETAHMK